MKTSVWMALLIAAAGCGKKDEEAKAKPEPAAKVDAASAAKPEPAKPAAAPAITLKPGESFGADLGADGENPVEWKTPSGSTALIGVVFTEGPDAETARLVVAFTDATGKATETEVATVDVNMAYGHGVDVEVGADGKALVRVDESGGSGDPGYLAAWRLAWDAAGKPVIEEHGQWAGDEDPAAWAARKPEP